MENGNISSSLLSREKTIQKGKNAARSQVFACWNASPLVRPRAHHFGSVQATTEGKTGNFKEKKKNL
jgi:hypothetical protein